MNRQDSNWPLLTGIAVSIILHLTLLVPLLMATMTTSRQADDSRPILFEEEIAPPLDHEQQEQEDPKLGIDEGTPSSVSWVGYEEYEEHIAQLAEMEQAAFTREPSGAMGIEDWSPQQDLLTPLDDSPSEDVVERIEHAPGEARDHEQTSEPDEVMTEAVEADDEITIAPEPLEEVSFAQPPISAIELIETPSSLIEEVTQHEAEVPVDTAGDVIEGEPEQPAEAKDDIGEHEEDAETVPADIDDETVEVQTDQTREDETADVVERETAQEDSESEPERDSSEQPESDSQSQPTPADAPPGEVRDGEETDKDSDPTSIIDVPRENWRLGRPLAARGVEIKPERPHFTLLQLMTGLPRNPVVGIRFSKTGVPSEAMILRSTGDSSIDAAILASLYRWRAEGEAIKKLDREQTFDIQIRIVLVQRRGEDD